MNSEKSAIAFAIVFCFVPVSVFGQTSLPSSGSKIEKVNHWSMTVTGGWTYHYDDRMFDKTTLSYLEYNVGYLIGGNHEVGLKDWKERYAGGKGF